MAGEAAGLPPHPQATVPPDPPAGNLPGTLSTPGTTETAGTGMPRTAGTAGTAGSGGPTPGGARRALGQWLREQRQARGWDVPRMARALAQAAGPARGELPSIGTLRTYVRRWENAGAGISERYRLLYSTALGIHPTQFGPTAATHPAFPRRQPSHPPTPHAPTTPPAPTAPPGPTAPPEPAGAPPQTPGHGSDPPTARWTITFTLTITPAPPGPTPGPGLPAGSQATGGQRRPAPGPPP